MRDCSQHKKGSSYFSCATWIGEFFSKECLHQNVTQLCVPADAALTAVVHTRVDRIVHSHRGRVHRVRVPAPSNDRRSGYHRTCQYVVCASNERRVPPLEQRSLTLGATHTSEDHPHTPIYFGSATHPHFKHFSATITHTHSHKQRCDSQVREMQAPLLPDARCDARAACCAWPALLPGTTLVHPMHLDTGLGIDSVLGELHHRPLLWPTT